MNQAQSDFPNPSLEPEAAQTRPRKDWVTPEVSESPVNEFTQDGSGSGNPDGVTYS